MLIIKNPEIYEEENWNPSNLAIQATTNDPQGMHFPLCDMEVNLYINGTLLSFQAALQAAAFTCQRVLALFQVNMWISSLSGKTLIDRLIDWLKTRRCFLGEAMMTQWKRQKLYKMNCPPHQLLHLPQSKSLKTVLFFFFLFFLPVNKYSLSTNSSSIYLFSHSWNIWSACRMPDIFLSVPVPQTTYIFKLVSSFTVAATFSEYTRTLTNISSPFMLGI